MPIDFNPIHHSPLGIQNRRMHGTFQAFEDEALSDLLRPKKGRSSITTTPHKENMVFAFQPSTILTYANNDFDDIREAILESANTCNGKIIINLGNVSILDSSALDMIVKLHKELPNRLILTNLNTDLTEIFEVSKLNKLVTIKPTEEEALNC